MFSSFVFSKRENGETFSGPRGESLLRNPFYPRDAISGIRR